MTRAAHVLLPLLSLTIVAACDGRPTVVAPGPASLSSADAASGPSATGGGWITFGASVELIAFTARQREDGTVTGQAEVHNQTAGVNLHIDINCLRVVGNLATLSGIVTRTSDPFIEGFQAIFQVQDNGEGGNSQPDLMSLVNVYVVGTGVDCSVPSEFDLTPLERGNVQVRP